MDNKTVTLYAKKAEKLKAIAESVLSAANTIEGTDVKLELQKTFKNSKGLKSDSYNALKSVFTNGEDTEPSNVLKLETLTSTIFAAKTQFERGLKTIQVKVTSNSPHSKSVEVLFVGVTHDINLCFDVEDGIVKSTKAYLDQLIQSPLISAVICEDFVLDAISMAENHANYQHDELKLVAHKTLIQHAAILDMISVS